jgi:integrase
MRQGAKTGDAHLAGNLVRLFKAVLQRVGLPTTIRIHDLRHSVPTILAALGEHPKVVQGILRHSDIKITMNAYTA